jgi:SNF2 family DNA or RNA helicase
VAYKWKTRPYRHQILAVKRALKLGNVALLMDPRTGKTKTTVDYLSILAQTRGVRKALIVCPNRIMDVWVDEIHAHCPLRVHVTVWDREARADKKPIPQASAVFDLHVVITNYETFSTPGKRLPSGARSQKTGRFKHRALVRKWIGKDKAACVLDEFHKMQDAGGKWSTMLVSMRDDFRYRLGLTGTPIPKAAKIHALYMMWQWLNPARFEDVAPNVTQFKQLTGTWVNGKSYNMWVAPRTEGVDLVHERIHEDAYCVRIEECFDMPATLPPRIISVKLKLNESAKIYDDLATKMVARLENGDLVDASRVVVQVLRLAQITGGTVIMPDLSVEVEPGQRQPNKLVVLGKEKLLALKEILTEEMLEQEQKCIIAARFRADLTRIERLCRKIDMPFFVLKGGMSRHDGTRAWKEFNKHGGPCAFVMQPQAGGMGIDLSTASHTIWYSLTPSYIDFTQSNQRNAKSPVPIQFTYLLVPNSVDSLMYEALIDDGDVAKRMMTRPHELLRR